jgi:hypothetical protein
MRERSLRRGVDRVEDTAAWLLTAAALVVLIVAGMVGVGVHTQASEQSRADRADRVQATAVLLADAGVRTIEHGAAAPFAKAAARWTDPSGRQHEGQVPARSYNRAGDEVPVWLDRTGELTSPPAGELNAVVGSAATAITVLAVGGGLIAAAWVGLRRIIFAHNARAWEREWARIGPEWSSQQPT